MGNMLLARVEGYDCSIPVGVWGEGLNERTCCASLRLHTSPVPFSRARLRMLLRCIKMFPQTKPWLPDCSWTSRLSETGIFFGSKCNHIFETKVLYINDENLKIVSINLVKQGWTKITKELYFKTTEEFFFLKKQKNKKPILSPLVIYQEWKNNALGQIYCNWDDNFTSHSMRATKESHLSGKPSL